jgi:pyrroline-5-carboxylate reductase
MATTKKRTRRRASLGHKPAASAARSRGALSRRRPLVGFIGAGNMARSLAGGLIANGWPAARIILSDPDASQRAVVEERLKVKTYPRNGDVAARAQILVLAVKPQTMRAVATEFAPAVRTARPLIVSIAAGIRLGDLARWLDADVALVRAMPNTPALVGAGVSGLYANARTNERMRAAAESILRAVGTTVWLADESLLDAVTAVSASGPAYFFLVMEALERAAVAEGLDPATARRLTLDTAFGAAKMAIEGAEEPATLRARVTSPGGTTERALAVFEQGGLMQWFASAVRAATERARELADLFGKGQ